MTQYQLNVFTGEAVPIEDPFRTVVRLSHVLDRPVYIPKQKHWVIAADAGTYFIGKGSVNGLSGKLQVKSFYESPPSLLLGGIKRGMAELIGMALMNGNAILVSEYSVDRVTCRLFGMLQGPGEERVVLYNRETGKFEAEV